MMNRPAGNAETDARLRTMRVLWAAFLLNVGLFVFVGRVIGADSESAAVGAGVPSLLLVLGAVGLSTVAASFILKAGFYGRAAARHEPARLQTGLILALALCETAALMGLVGLLVTASGYAYLLFALGALGMALHFPRREQVEAVFYRSVM